MGSNEYFNKPMAAAPYISYRCEGAYGYIMIGALDHEDAWRQALLSSDTAKRETLSVWAGTKYTPVS